MIVPGEVEENFAEGARKAEGHFLEPCAHVSNNLNSLNGVYIGDYVI